MPEEKDCGTIHPTVEHAIQHAEARLGWRRRPAPAIEPYAGTTRFNDHLVVGYQESSRQRWRLDWDEDKGIHVNEENYDASLWEQRTCHRVDAFRLSGADLVRLYWNRWTSRYGDPRRW